MNCTTRVAKTKALISFAVTAKLICAFVFAYAKCLFSHAAAQDCDGEIRVAKTKALISFAVTAKLICTFVFTYAKCWFSHAAAQDVMARCQAIEKGESLLDDG